MSSELDNTSTGNPKSFLDLPGNIRNKIYTYLDESAHNHPRAGRTARLVLTSVTTSNPSTTATPLPQLPPEKYKTHRKFLSLSQTCRLLRHEYHPLWLQSTTLSLHPSHLRPLFTTFFPAFTPATPLPPRGSVTGPRVLDAEWDRVFPTEDEPLDVLPLVQLHVCCGTKVRVAPVRGARDADRDRDVVEALGPLVEREVRRGEVQSVRWWVTEDRVDLVRVSYVGEEGSGVFVFREAVDDAEEEEDEYEGGDGDRGDSEDY